MSRTEGVNVRAIPSPSPRYDRGNEAQFRRAMELSLERLNSRIQTVGIGDDETLLDPDADETISGDWDFTGSPTLPESSITDGSILARLADNETVTGTWTFSGTPVVIGTDPGGGETLRVGGGVRGESLSMTDPDDSDYRLQLTVDASFTDGLGNSLPTRGAGLRTRHAGTSGSLNLAQVWKDNGGTIIYDQGEVALQVADNGSRKVEVGEPSSGHVVNVVHHGTGTPSSVGVEGTLHTQDA